MQVIDVDCVNTKTKENVCYYENDSILVSYYFWAEKGIMSFTIYNKLSIPIYVDWKKSALISNSTKLNYWEDEEFTNTKTTYTSNSFTFSEDFFKPIITLPNHGGVTTYGEVFNLSLGTTVGESYSNSTKSKPERVTFIPPKSNFFKPTMHLTDFSFVEYNKKNFSEEIVPSSLNDKKTTKIMVAQLTGKNIFLSFRNFLTLSTNENFTNEFYVDNEFKVKTVTMMKENQFRGKYDRQQNADEFPYRKSSSYYYVYPYGIF